MTVSQVGRTTNSVTINVSGITEGYRQTYIWIPGLILNSDKGEWYTLQNAKANGYISDFYATSIDGVNGDITVWIADEYLQYKVVDLKVENVDGSTREVLYWIITNTVLDFEYENSFPKVKGEDIDITLFDMQEINLFGSYIDSWINLGDGTYYPLDDVLPHSQIYAIYLWQPAKNMLDAAIDCIDELGTNYDKVWGYLSGIVDNCVSGADFKALWFNQIVYAIRNFNLSMTI